MANDRPNREIARLLHELAILTELDEGGPQSFRARAYQGAVRAVEGAEDDLTALPEDELVRIKGIGKGIARKIRQYAETGSIDALEELRERYPPGYRQLARIPGLGPKTLALLREELGIETLEDLRASLEAQELRHLHGLGPKTEENLARAIERLGLTDKERRVPIAEALPVAEGVVAALAEVPGVERVRHAGSLRRFQETIGDVDVVVATLHPDPVMDRFCTLPVVAGVVARGDTKSSVTTASGLQIDLRVVDPGQFGAALLYFTGSKAHNIRLRQRAVERGWTLNEYGLFEGDRVIASATEEDVYRALGLPYLPPTLREDSGELEAAERGELPDLVQVEHLRGDLHTHTDLSGDGRMSLEELVGAAADRGHAYLAVTDHGVDLAINGATREEMLAQRERIRHLAGRYPGMTLLHGAELNIGSDGGLDYDRDFLLSFDWCVASIHSHFDLDPDRQTERLLTAVRHPAVNAIGHLTGRRIGRRPGIELRLDPVLDALAETGTALEVNCHLDRLDASADVLRRAVRRKVLVAISTDAHSLPELDRLGYGVLTAQRGWVERASLVNTWERNRFLAWVEAKRKGARGRES